MASSSSSFTLITLLSLALVASITKARVAPDANNNWQGVAKGEAMVEAIEHLAHGESTSLSSKKNDCHTSSDNQHQNAFVRDFEPRPNLSVYPIDGKLKYEKTFMRDFESRHSATAYPDEEVGLEAKKGFVKDFEPRPSISAYPDEEVGLEVKKEFVKGFESKPNISVYQS